MAPRDTEDRQRCRQHHNAAIQHTRGISASPVRRAGAPSDMLRKTCSKKRREHPRICALLWECSRDVVLSQSKDQGPGRVWVSLTCPDRHGDDRGGASRCSRGRARASAATAGTSARALQCVDDKPVFGPRSRACAPCRCVSCRSSRSRGVFTKMITTSR